MTFKIIGDPKPELLIDPGHGGKDPGASGNGIIEKLLTLAISLYQYNRFKELGVRVALTRDSDVTLDSNARALLVKNSGAKYCISNHINAAASASAAGVETIHSIHNNGKLATALMQAIADAGQLKRSRPVFSKPNTSGGDYYYMHRLTGNASTVIVEYGFCSNPADAARLLANWQAYAESVVKAYCLFVGHKYTPPAGMTQPPVTPPTTQPAQPLAPAAPVSDQVNIHVNGKLLDQKGTLKNGVTTVPVRAVAEALGAKVTWDAATRTVNIDK
ncbi:N-acetylmuramoyl-L-alanine amidase [Paenibacillus paeoniae]|nr:N-acetylmuramoyl-L-alanine amidase [Paenibacillus paeoniae]